MNNLEWWKNATIGGLVLMAILVYADFIRNTEKYGEIVYRYEQAKKEIE